MEAIQHCMDRSSTEAHTQRPTAPPVDPPPTGAFRAMSLKEFVDVLLRQAGCFGYLANREMKLQRAARDGTETAILPQPGQKLPSETMTIVNEWVNLKGAGVSGPVLERAHIAAEAAASQAHADATRAKWLRHKHTGRSAEAGAAFEECRAATADFAATAMRACRMMSAPLPDSAIPPGQPFTGNDGDLAEHLKHCDKMRAKAAEFDNEAAGYVRVFVEAPGGSLACVCSSRRPTPCTQVCASVRGGGGQARGDAGERA